jgi:4-amino-4-deoxy-L-arabinose transferase-like glycosyltransferase
VKGFRGGFLFSGGLFFTAFLAVLIVVFTGMFVPVIENACKYAQVSREILDNGDWINLTIAHAPYGQKPPLLFWIGALFYSFFGVSLFAFKLPVWILSWVGIFSTYRLGRLLYNRKVGWLAAFLWATSLGYLHFHNDIHTDTVLVNFVILAIWQFTAFFKEKKWHLFVIGSISIGLAMLAKGPIGLAIPMAALGIHLLIHRKGKEIFHVRWLLAILIAGIVVAPALIGLFNQFGMSGLKFYFWTNNIGRVTGTYHSSDSGIFLYFHNLILVSLPWFMFVYPALILEIRKCILQIIHRRKLRETDEFITLGGFVVTFVVLTVASQKNPHYLLSVMPLAMILTAKWILEIFNGNVFKKLKNVITGINYAYPIIIAVLVLLVMLLVVSEKRVWLWILFLAATGGLFFIYRKFHGLKKQIYLLLVVQVLFFVYFNLSIFPSMLNQYSTFKACRTFNEEADPEDQLHSLRLRYWSIFYYSKNYGEWITDEQRMKEISARGGVWVFTDGSGLNALDHWGITYTLRGEYPHRNLKEQTADYLLWRNSERDPTRHYLVELDD